MGIVTLDHFARCVGEGVRNRYGRTLKALAVHWDTIQSRTLLWNGKRRRRSFGHRGVRRGPSRRVHGQVRDRGARVTPNSERTSSVVAQSIGAATCAASFAVAVVAATTRSPSLPASSRRPAVGPPDVAAANACRSGATSHGEKRGVGGDFHGEKIGAHRASRQCLCAERDDIGTKPAYHEEITWIDDGDVAMVLFSQTLHHWPAQSADIAQPAAEPAGGVHGAGAFIRKPQRGLGGPNSRDTPAAISPTL